MLCGMLDVPIPPARLIADWDREVSRQGLEPGDVEPLPLARARVRWPDYACCVKAVSDWTHTLELLDVLSTSDVALMACRGARYHLDATHYGGAAFCNLFLSEDRGLDLHFPSTGRRIPLTRGTAVIFDTGHPHAVIQRGSSGFNGVAVDIDPVNALQMNEEQVWLNGARAIVCPDSGRCSRAD